MKLDFYPVWFVDNVTTQHTDLGEQSVEIGMLVEMVTRKIRDDDNQRGIIVYGYKFRPAVASTIATE